MNHKQRIRAVLAGQLPDRIPVSTWGHDFLREWSADDLAAHTIERHRKYDYDFVKLNPRWTMFAEPWGNTYQPPTEQKFPRLTHKVVSNISDLAAIPRVAPDHPVFAEHVDAVRQVVTAIGDDVDVIATVFSPLSVLGLLTGGVGEPVNTFARQAPDQVHETLAHIADTLAGHTADLIDAGASGVFYAALQWTSLDVCDNDFYNEFGRAYDQRVMAVAADAPLNVFHVCGNNVDLPRFFDFPAQVINWDNFGPGNQSLAAASQQTSKIVAGGIPHRKLHKIDEVELARISAEVLEGAGNNVILAGGCGVGAMVPDAIRRSATQVAARIGRPSSAKP